MGEGGAGARTSDGAGGAGIEARISDGGVGRWTAATGGLEQAKRRVRGSSLARCMRDLSFGATRR
jgi:hypothetical protein